MIKPALFLDRDGVINIDKGYVHKPEDCQFVDGIFELVARAYAIDMPVIVATNQAGIARGYYSEEQYQKFNSWMREQFSVRGTPLSAVYHCPHHPTAGLGDYRCECNCRKPAPGMLLAARDTFNLDMTRSVLVGDTLTDMQAAISAGIGNQWLLVHKPLSNTDVIAMVGAYSKTLHIVDSLLNIDLIP